MNDFLRYVFDIFYASRFRVRLSLTMGAVARTAGLARFIYPLYLSRSCMKRIDVSLRLGNAPAPWGLPEFGLADEHITYAARSNESAGFRFVGNARGGEARTDLAETNHLFRARHYSRRAVLRRRGQSL